MRTCFARLAMVVIAAVWTLFWWCATVCAGQIEISSHWLNATEDDSYDSYKTENTSSWWVAANTVCTRSGGHLFVPRQQSNLDDLTNLLDENKVYWIGGFQYSSLIWTEDASRYYRRLGSTLDVYGRNVLPSTMDDNSPFTCNVRCGNTSGLFGLKGRSCYCLGHRSVQRILSLNIENITNMEIRCPGDYDELCGNDKRISVYAGDTISISRSGTCGYMRKNSGDNTRLQFHLDDDCRRKRSYAYKKPTGGTRLRSRLRCRGDVCVSKKKGSWPDADREIPGLLKVTDANREDLYSAMHYGEYWIGLRRFQEYKWINGNRVARNMSSYHVDKRCLAVRRVASQVQVAWYPCSDTYSAVCQSKKPDKTEDDPGIKPGVVASIVALLVLCFILAAILFKRKGLYCFKANGETDRGHSVNSPNQLHRSQDTVPNAQTKNVTDTDRHIIILNTGPCDGDAVYSEIGSCAECHGSFDPYTGPYLPIRTEDGEFNTTRPAQQVRRHDSTYNHLHTGNDLRASDQDENVYHELSKL